jgi:hypothetical protein
VLGLAAGLALAGRMFGSGLLLNVDLVIGDRIPMPPGQFGAGLELPRRVPFYSILSPLTWLVPGPVVAGAVTVGAVTAAVAGVSRLVERTCGPARAPVPARVVALALGLFYGLSPMLLTRVAVGHLPLVVAMALLPWAACSLRANAEAGGPWSWALFWGGAFAVTGSAGSVVGLVLVGFHVALGAGPVVVRFGRLLALAATQAVWLFPGLAVLGAGSALPTTDWRGFASRVSDFGGEGQVAGVLALVVGGGFFARAEDVARAGLGATSRPVVTILAAVVVVLFVIGFTAAVRNRRLPGGPALWLSGLMGAMLVLAPIAPGLWRLWDALLAWPAAGIVREPQKFWPLAGLVLVVAMGWVLHRLPGRFTGAGLSIGLAALTVAAAWPGLWGASGRLVVAEVPEPWAAIEAELDGEGGRLVVFPWRRYHFLDLSGGRNIIGPAPWLLTGFEGDVVASGDPGFNDGGSERSESLESEFDRLDTEVRAARPIVPELQRLGVRWLLVEGSPESAFYRRVGSESNATIRVADGNYLLVEIEGYEEWELTTIRTLGVVIGLVGALVTITLSFSGWLSKRRWDSGFSSVR